jgi:hypothetical protein
MGNILAIADNKLNIIIVEKNNWEKVTGIINCNLLFPKLWDVFMYDDHEIK